MPAATEWGDRHPAKAQLRHQVWTALQHSGAAIRDPVGHIPHFVGAEAAADQLAALPFWQPAQVIKCNPDRPQAPVRLRALQDGKRLYMAVPRLTRRQCFVELDPATLQQQGIPFKQVAAMRQALIHGRLVSFEEMQPIDLVVVGSVAATVAGGRTGKGAGFADLELAMLQLFSLLKPNTQIVTTIHPLQLVDADQLPVEPHDWPLDWVVMPEGAIATHHTFPKPTKLDWATIQPDQYRKIPILKQLCEKANKA
ncbi:MAG: 5-formyltetrahydrofolate cyclo-ligase [Cyanobacteria bacterium J069]|nr:MAG: 5-formyltetrahydrofolate cyclo-ligase [Cyanobacteria bacterium J069]